MNWTAIEKAIYDWVVAASGLAAGNVIWERGTGPRPSGTWIGLRRGFSLRGRPWLDTEDNPLVLANDAVESVDTGADTLTLTAHAYQTGDGPFQLTTTGTLPTPLAVDTDYWIIVVDVNTIKLAATFAESVAATPTPIDLTDAGTGTHTIETQTGTERAGEEIEHTSRSPGVLTISMQCYGGDATDGNSPEAVLELVRAKSSLPSIADPLDTAGIGIATFSEVQPLDLSLGDTTDARALLTVTAHVAEEVTETGTYIETADLTEDPPIS